jgi:hypothetical protein
LCAKCQKNTEGKKMCSEMSGFVKESDRQE